MAAGLGAAEVRVRARLAARRRREDDEDARSTRSRRPTSSPTSASTASATTSSPTSASAPTATSPTRRWSQRYNADLANNFGNLANRVLEHGGELLRRRRARRRARTVRSSTPRRRAFDGDAATAMDAPRLRERRSARCGTSSARPTRTSRTGSRGRCNKAGDADAVAAVLGDCLEALRIVALLASPVIPNAAAELWRRLGLPGRPEDQRLPDAARVGPAARGRDAGEGRAAVPRRRDVE